MNKDRLFTASCIALIATAMSFAIRGDIMGELQQLFQLNDTQLGWIGGAAFWGFGLSILLGGPLCDLLGMGNIMNGLDELQRSVDFLKAKRAQYYGHQ